TMRKRAAFPLTPPGFISTFGSAQRSHVGIDVGVSLPCFSSVWSPGSPCSLPPRRLLERVRSESQRRLGAGRLGGPEGGRHGGVPRSGPAEGLVDALVGAGG